MDNYERVTISDAFIQNKWQEGDKIITEGELGNVFYFVIEGECAAVKKINGEEVEVM